MPSNDREERDIVLDPNQFTFIKDRTSGNISAAVGPYKAPLSDNQELVTFNGTQFVKQNQLDRSIQTQVIAPENWYIILKNPMEREIVVKDADSNTSAQIEEVTPDKGKLNTPPDEKTMKLMIGKKVIIPGPTARSLWPGQIAKVVRGHHLRSNQYLLLQVYDEEQAKKNLKNIIIKTAEGDDVQQIKESDLTTGKLIILKGTDVSFFIPPTGIEVVEDRNVTGGDKFVRAAVTLERLEYCILLNEDGDKRYCKGPDVVFPEPTEVFMKSSKGSRRFKAVELTETSGLYLKVIADYEENDKQFKMGQELFITGKDQMIYFPRKEHATISYTNRKIHYAIAIPAGEGRYVLSRVDGQIPIKSGPAMFLPDPRKEVIVRRILSERQVQLWYPDNTEALEYNRELQEMANKAAQQQGGEQQQHLKQFISEDQFETRSSSQNVSAPDFVIEVDDDELGIFDEDDDDEYLIPASDEEAEPPKSSKRRKQKKAPAQQLANDDFTRRAKYTPPRTVTLDTKYEGVPEINVWTGYAIQVVSKTGNRKVIQGESYLMEYDDELEVLELSAGVPKGSKPKKETVYLRVKNNRVMDSIQAITSDMVTVQIKVSYRVNFEEDNPNKWFEVRDYVKLMTDHMRSRLRNTIQKLTIQEFNNNSIDIIRDTILGKVIEGGARSGFLFEENNMRIYDAEILDTEIGDAEIHDMLVESQRKIVRNAITAKQDQDDLQAVELHEEVEQKKIQAMEQTRKLQSGIEIDAIKREGARMIADSETDIGARLVELEGTLKQQENESAIQERELERKKRAADIEKAIADQTWALSKDRLESETRAIIEKLKAIDPHLIGTLQQVAKADLLKEIAPGLAPLAIAKQQSLSGALEAILKDTGLEHVLERFNGDGKGEGAE